MRRALLAVAALLACAPGAVARAAGRRARTNAKGLARLRARFAHSGRVRVTVRAGRRTGHAFVRVAR